MKVAIIHEWLTSVGGSDKVARAILDLFPNADIYTLVSNRQVCKELGINYEKVHNSFIQNLPFGKTRYRAYLPLMPYAIEQFDLTHYDLIISSSHAVAKGVITKNSQLHICYCHSPIRYAWDMYHEYLKNAKLTKGIKGFVAKFFLHKIRLWDVLSSYRVDYFISNSDYIGKRISKIYKRDSRTIYPNVCVENFEVHTKKEDFYLASSRLVGYKKIDLIVQAFNQMPEKRLIVIGGGPDLKKIKKIAKQNITVLGYQPFDVLKEHLQKAKGFVFAADEDFGIIPVEAQACGTPVIAFGYGGVRETVINKKTGFFFYEQTARAICDAIVEFEKIEHNFNVNEIRRNSERFSEERFKKEFFDYVVEKYNTFKEDWK